MLGLLLIVVEFLIRVKIDRPLLTYGGIALVLAAAFATHARAAVWSDDLAVWQDTASKSPGAWRPHFQLAFAYYKAQKYNDALQEFQKAGDLHPLDADLLLDWGLTYDSLNQLQPALERLKESAAIKLAWSTASSNSGPTPSPRSPRPNSSTRVSPTPTSISVSFTRAGINSAKRFRISSTRSKSTRIICAHSSSSRPW
jgi:hypothetical protein